MIKVFRFVAICPRYCVDGILDRVRTNLYDYRLAGCRYHHSERRSQSARYQRRQLHRHIECYSRFRVNKKDVFTSFDPPGSTSATPNFINPQGVIVGS
jgi:hypothetical protein